VPGERLRRYPPKRNPRSGDPTAGHGGVTLRASVETLIRSKS
jgi:hypothetical protein